MSRKIEMAYDTTNWAWFKANVREYALPSLMAIACITACVLCTMHAIDERYLGGPSALPFHTYTISGALFIGGATASSVIGVLILIGIIHKSCIRSNEKEIIPKYAHETDLTAKEKHELKAMQLVAIAIVTGLFITCTVLAIIADQETYSETYSIYDRDTGYYVNVLELEHTFLGSVCYAVSAIAGIVGILGIPFASVPFLDPESMRYHKEMSEHDIQAITAPEIKPQELRKLLVLHSRAQLGPYRRAGYFDKAPPGKTESYVDFIVRKTREYDALMCVSEMLDNHCPNKNAILKLSTVEEDETFHEITNENAVGQADLRRKNTDIIARNQQRARQRELNQKLQTKYDQEVAAWQSKKHEIESKIATFVAQWQKEASEYQRLPMFLEVQKPRES